jgi:hypothetical protein
MLEHFDAVSPAYNGTPFKTGTETMLEKGYSFDYISDLQIKNTETINALLHTEGNSYKTLILPGCKYIPVETFSQILSLANNGADIIVYGNLPENVSGWANLEEKTVVFNQMKESLKFNETDNKSILQAVVGDGKIIIGSDLNSLLSFAGIRRETMADAGIKFIRRRSASGSLYFLKNQTEKPFEGCITLQTEAKSAALFNPMNEKYGTAKKRMTKEGEFEIYIKLGKGESMVVETFNNKVPDKPYLFYNTFSDPQEIKGKWKLEFTEGGPMLPEVREIDNLISWTETGGDDVKNFSGTARYTISFNKPAISGDAWVINLGKVCESARVILNGQELAVLIGPEYQVLVDKKFLKPNNILEIKVSNLMANRIAWMDRNKIEWKKFYNVNMAARLKENNKNGIFDASAWQPRESGLIGPVTITPVNKRK